MCSLKIPPQVIKQIDIYRKYCLWSKGGINKKGTCLVAWEEACKPKDEGGLGIVDIKTQNKALLLKFLDKFYHKKDTPWVQLTWTKLYANSQTPPQDRSPVGSFWWKDILGYFEDFKNLTTCRANKGDTLSFRSQVWINASEKLKDMHPQLYSYARKPKCSVKFFIEQEYSTLFRLPLSQQAAQQLDEIINSIEASEMDSEQDDYCWSYNWGQQYIQ